MGVFLALVLLCACEPKLDEAAPAADALAEGAVAVVNGVPILRADYDQILSTEATSKQRPLTEAERQAAIDGLIEEELSIQQALEKGMVRHDPNVRRTVLNAVRSAIRKPAEDREPTEEEIAAAYEQQREELARPGPLHVRQIIVRADAGDSETVVRKRAEEALRRLRAGEDFARVRRELGSSAPDPLPDELVSADEVRRWLGSSVHDHVAELEPGSVSEIQGTGLLLRVVKLIAKKPKIVPELSEVRDTVARSLRTERGDRALAENVERLRKKANVRVQEPLP
jgi:hypothetical protein